MNEEEKYQLSMKKAELVKGAEYKEIRSLQLNQIVELSALNIDPVVVKGMLYLIFKTDNWAEEFEKLKSKK